MATQPRRSSGEVAALILDELLAVRAGETVAIVRDDDSPDEMLAAFLAALSTRGTEYAVLHQPSRPPARKNELNPAVAKGLEATDVMIALTMSGGAPIYAAEVKALMDAKRLRFMSMVMRDMDVLTGGGATADYRAVQADGERLCRIWSQGRVMRITSAAGTDISAPIAADHVIIECGYATEPGTSAAFSDGEVSSRPLEGEANGVVVVDGPGAVIGQPDAPVTLEVTAGRVTRVGSEGAAAATLRHLVRSVENADNVAEFGIGLNPACRRNGKFEEVKKLRGQVHIAIGDNIFYGGMRRSPVHIDLVVTDPTVTLDGREIVRAGEVLLD